MTNYFSGIISSDLKQLYRDAISSLLYNTALTVPCKLYYGVTKYESCPNCVASNIGQIPSCRYIAGGPIPFPMGSICPMCNGDGKRPVVSTENISLMVIWNSTEFMNQTTVADDSQDRIQTITFKENTPKLVRAESLVVATGISAYTQHRYQRMGSPRPCGFGDTDFVECIWKRL